jgi:hypothetical protein
MKRFKDYFGRDIRLTDNIVKADSQKHRANGRRFLKTEVSAI